MNQLAINTAWMAMSCVAFACIGTFAGWQVRGIVENRSTMTAKPPAVPSAEKWIEAKQAKAEVIPDWWPHKGVVVRGLSADGSDAAYRDGLRIGDLIVEVNGKRVNGAESVFAFQHESFTKRNKVKVLRGSEYKTINTTRLIGVAIDGHSTAFMPEAK
jgi:membrane-associated protease RseP (regulator of RpoE activity)